MSCAVEMHSNLHFWIAIVRVGFMAQYYINLSWKKYATLCDVPKRLQKATTCMIDIY